MPPVARNRNVVRDRLVIPILAFSAACSTGSPDSNASADSTAQQPALPASDARVPDTAIVETLRSPADSNVLDSLTTALSPRLAALDSAFASIPGVIRPDSGTYRADSLLLAIRRDLDRQIRRIITAVDDSAFQLLLYPAGYRGQQLRRAQGRAGQPPLASELAVADSLRRFLLSHGIWSYPAEGDTYFELSLARLLRSASPFITDAVREALQIEKREQEVPTGGDAAVAIPWDSLGDRLAATDRYLATYPDAPTRATIEELRGRYLFAFLTGWANTAIFDYDTQELRPDVRRSFERYLQLHGTTTSAAALREFMDLLARTEYRLTPEVGDFLRTRSGIPIH